MTDNELKDLIFDSHLLEEVCLTTIAKLFTVKNSKNYVSGILNTKRI